MAGTPHCGALAAPLVVILAGGEGTRMGGGKPLRRLGGETLLDRALRRTADWSDDVRVALRSIDQLPDLPAPVLLDDPEIWGPLAGLKSALEAARASGRSHVLTVPCDTPFLPEDLPLRLATAIEGHGAAIAASGGQLHPVCALWSVAVLDAIGSYRASGRRSLKGLAEMVGAAIVQCEESEFVNVNTPADLAAAELRLASQSERRDR